jgi:hypothetical protein
MNQDEFRMVKPGDLHEAADDAQVTWMEKLLAAAAIIAGAGPIMIVLGVSLGSIDPPCRKPGLIGSTGANLNMTPSNACCAKCGADANQFTWTRSHSMHSVEGFFIYCKACGAILTWVPHHSSWTPEPPEDSE